MCFAFIPTADHYCIHSCNPTTTQSYAACHTQSYQLSHLILCSLSHPIQCSLLHPNLPSCHTQYYAAWLSNPFLCSLSHPVLCSLPHTILCSLSHPVLCSLSHPILPACNTQSNAACHTQYYTACHTQSNAACHTQSYQPVTPNPMQPGCRTHCYAACHTQSYAALSTGGAVKHNPLSHYGRLSNWVNGRDVREARCGNSAVGAGPQPACRSIKSANAAVRPPNRTLSRSSAISCLGNCLPLTHSWKVYMRLSNDVYLGLAVLFRSGWYLGALEWPYTSIPFFQRFPQHWL